MEQSQFNRMEILAKGAQLMKRARDDPKAQAILRGTDDDAKRELLGKYELSQPEIDYIVKEINEIFKDRIPRPPEGTEAIFW